MSHRLLTKFCYSNITVTSLYSSPLPPYLLCSFSSLWSILIQKQVIFLMDGQQQPKATSQSLLAHLTMKAFYHFTSSQKKDKYSTIRCFQRLHSHNFTTVYCSNYSILGGYIYSQKGQRVRERKISSRIYTQCGAPSGTQSHNPEIMT